MPKPLILALPVDSAWTFVGLDIYFIMIHINLGNVHFKVVGQELDGLPNSSYPGPTRRLKYLLQGWQVCACSCREKTVRRVGTNPMPRQTDNAASQRSPSLHPEPGVSHSRSWQEVAVAEFGPAQLGAASLSTIQQAPALAEPSKGSTKPSALLCHHQLCRCQTIHQQINNHCFALGKVTYLGPRLAVVQTFRGQGTPITHPSHGYIHVLAYTMIPITQFPDQMWGQKATFGSPDTEGQVVPNFHVKIALKAPAMLPQSCTSASVSHKKCHNT